MCSFLNNLWEIDKKEIGIITAKKKSFLNAVIIFADLHSPGETLWLKVKSVILCLVKDKVAGLHLKISVVTPLVGQDAALLSVFFYFIFLDRVL